MDSFEKRANILRGVFLLCFAALFARLAYLQLFQHGYYESEAARRQTTERVFTAQRGEILAQEKDRLFSVATTKEGWIFAINPKQITDPVATYVAIEQVVPGLMTREDFMERATKVNDPHEVIARRLSRDQKEAIEGLRLTGITFEREDWRMYPAGSFAAHTLGFVGADREGKYGVERFYNGDLEGEDGVFQGDKASGGRLLFLGKQIFQREEDGADVILTIDAGVQTYLERQIQDIKKKYSAASAGGIIVNPKTGRVLALAALPGFDPNMYSKVDDIGVFKNPHAESLFEMGSVVKPLTMAAAIDSGSVTRETTYVDKGELHIDQAVIKNYDGKARGRVAIQEILSQSLNTGTVFLMESMGRDTFRTYLERFELNKKTGIDLPNESSGNLKNLQSSRMIEYATASFGQGISMTPIELVRALGSVANGGMLIDPYIVDGLRYDNGTVISRKKNDPRRVIKEETSREVTRMLVEVVDKKLANGKGKIPGYSVAAKTGTAQIAGTTGGGYSGEFLHTFFGYGPAYDPQFLIFLYVERPRGVQYASETLTEPFRSTIRYLFSYFEIPPDRAQELN